MYASVLAATNPWPAVGIHDEIQSRVSNLQYRRDVLFTRNIKAITYETDIDS